MPAEAAVLVPLEPKTLEAASVGPGFYVRPSFSLQLRPSSQAQLEKREGSSRQLLPIYVSYLNLALKTSSKKLILVLFFTLRFCCNGML